MSTEKQISKDGDMVYAFIPVLLAGFIVGLVMYYFNDKIRNPDGHRVSIKEWKLSLRSKFNSQYFDQIRTSLMLSLNDSTYLSLSDSQLVSLLMSAQVVSVSGYVPKVEEFDREDRVRMRDRYAQGEYFAIVINHEYVLVVNNQCVPVWGTRPLENKIAPNHQIKALRVPQRISLRFFIFFQ